MCKCTGVLLCVHQTRFFFGFWAAPTMVLRMKPPSKLAKQISKTARLKTHTPLYLFSGGLPEIQAAELPKSQVDFRPISKISTLTVFILFRKLEMPRYEYD